MSLGLYLVIPDQGGPPVWRQRGSLAVAQRKALEEFPGGVLEVRHVPPSKLAATVAEGFSLPPVLDRRFRSVIQAPQRKQAARDRAAASREAKHAAEMEARKQARRLAAESRKRARLAEARAAERAAARAAAAVPTVPLPECPEWAAWAPWEDGPQGP